MGKNIPSTPPSRGIQGNREISRSKTVRRVLFTDEEAQEPPSPSPAPIREPPGLGIMNAGDCEEAMVIDSDPGENEHADNTMTTGWEQAMAKLVDAITKGITETLRSRTGDPMIALQALATAFTKALNDTQERDIQKNTPQKPNKTPKKQEKTKQEKNRGKPETPKKNDKTESTTKGSKGANATTDNANKATQAENDHTLWTTVVKAKHRPVTEQQKKRMEKAGPIQRSPACDTRILLRYNDSIPDAAAVKIALQEALPAEARQLITDVRNTRKAVAIHVKTMEDQARLRPFRDEIIRIAKCKSADVTEKWERLLFRGIRTQYIDLNMQHVSITQEDIAKEVCRNHPYGPKKVIMNPALEEGWCNVILFFPTDQCPGPNFTLFGNRNGAIRLEDRGRPTLCKNCNTFHPGLCRKEKSCPDCGARSHPGTCEKRCTSCHSPNHSNEDSRCPLRPKYKEKAWHYPNAWAIQARRHQEKMERAAKQATATRKEKRGDTTIDLTREEPPFSPWRPYQPVGEFVPLPGAEGGDDAEDHPEYAARPTTYNGDGRRPTSLPPTFAGIVTTEAPWYHAPALPTGQENAESQW